MMHKWCLIKLGIVLCLLMECSNSLFYSNSSSSTILSNDGSIQNSDINRQLQTSIESLHNDVKILQKNRISLTTTISNLETEVIILNQEKMISKDKIRVLEADVMTLKQDKLKLEEKVRFLEKAVQNDTTNGSALQDLRQDVVAIQGILNDSYVTKASSSVLDQLGILSLSLAKHNEELQKLRRNFTVTDMRMSSFQSNVSTILKGLQTRVGFTAVFISSIPTITWSQYQTVVFPKLMYSVGGGYSTTSGIFTVPLDGTYVFFCSVQVYYRKTFWIYIMINGKNMAGCMAWNDNGLDLYQTGSNLLYRSLQRGDKVWVEYNRGGGMYSYFPETTFSGFRI